MSNKTSLHSVRYVETRDADPTQPRVPERPYPSAAPAVDLHLPLHPSADATPPSDRYIRLRTGRAGGSIPPLRAADLSGSRQPEIGAKIITDKKASRMWSATTPPPTTRPHGQLLEQALAEASVDASRLGVGVIGGLALVAGFLDAAGIQGRQRRFEAARCPGGVLAGVHQDLAGYGVSAAKTNGCTQCTALSIRHLPETEEGVK
jgi:hypothetical protein